MPTASIDFTMAAIAMIVVVLGAVYGVSIVVAPHLDDSVVSLERFRQIGRYILLTKGAPADWGTGGIPTNLGLASGSEPYRLDIDKVTRLNSDHSQSVDYATLWLALGVDDVSFQISIEPLFNLTLTLDSYQNHGASTTYNFSASTERDGYPFPCKVHYYLAVGNSTSSFSGSTGLDGLGSVEINLANSRNGTAILVGMARAEEYITSFDALPFAHNVSEASQLGVHATLSPINHTLKVSLADGASVWNAAVLSYDYSFNLTASGSDFIIPKLLGGSPMVVTVTGVNGSERWAEWVSYPMVPLIVGGEMGEDYVVSDLMQVEYVVDVDGGLYRCVMRFRSPAEYD